MERPDFTIFSGSKEYRYGLIIDKYQSHNTPSLILKDQYGFSWKPLVRPSGGP
jgi:hypothetical protein